MPRIFFAPAAGIIVDRSGTVTVGGVSQQIMAENLERAYLFIQNISDSNMWINFGVVAVAAHPSIRIGPGDSFVMSTFISSQYVSLYCTTTGKEFVAKEA